MTRQEVASDRQALQLIRMMLFSMFRQATMKMHFFSVAPLFFRSAQDTGVVGKHTGYKAQRQ
jgi:hypothetical protein